MSRTEENAEKTPDWAEIRARFEAGVNVAQLARDTGIKASVIGYRRRKEKWQVTQQHEKNLRVWENLPKVAEQLQNQEAGEELTDSEKWYGRALDTAEKEGSDLRRPETPALSQNPLCEVAKIAQNAPDLDPLTREVAKEIALLMDHQRQVSRARMIATDIISRLEEVLIKGETRSTIRIRQVRDGKEFLLPFLGHRESVSDALVKIASALQRLVPLERQAHGLLPKEQDAGAAPAVTVNIGAFAVGKRTEAQRDAQKPGRVIESEASAIKDATKHLN